MWFVDFCSRRKFIVDNEIQIVWTEGLSKAMEERLEKYFSMHEGQEVPSGLYARIIEEIEKSLIKTTLKYTSGNQLKAAKILGLNRNTLRKKISAITETQTTMDSCGKN